MPYPNLILLRAEKMRARPISHWLLRKTANSTSLENDYARGDRVWWSVASKVKPTLLNLDSHASNSRDWS